MSGVFTGLANISCSYSCKVAHDDFIQKHKTFGGNKLVMKCRHQLQTDQVHNTWQLL